MRLPIRKAFRSVGLAVTAALVWVPAGHAFRGEEHEALTDLALAVALESLDGSIDAELASDLRGKLLDCPVDPEERVELCDGTGPVCVPLGRITRAVDRMTRPEGLVPAEEVYAVDFSALPPRCGQPDGEPTRTIIRARERHREPEELFRFTACRAERKAEQVWGWLRAAHENAGHFEKCAEVRYNRLHELAVDLARKASAGEAEPYVALMAEAVALHFLQDSFAPGHLLTPRGRTTDILARGMHNGHNRAGAPIFVDQDALGDLREALDRVRSNGASELVRSRSKLLPDQLSAQQKPCPEPALERDGPSSAPQRCHHFVGVENGSTLADACYYGDDLLERTRQAADLVLLSAASIRDVLRALGPSAQEDPGPLLKMVFHEWAARADGNLPDRETLERPFVILTRAEPPGLDAAAKPLGGFRALAHGDNDRFSMSLRHPELSLAAVFGDSGQDRGIRAEVAIPFGSPADDDIRRLDEDGEAASPVCDSDATYFGRRNRGAHRGVPVAWTIQAEDWSHYRAAGLTGRAWNAHRWRGWDLMYGPEVGWKWYQHDSRVTDRFVWGGRLAVGYGLIFVELGFERGSLLEEDGGQKRNTNYSIGARVQIP